MNKNLSKIFLTTFSILIPILGFDFFLKLINYPSRNSVIMLLSGGRFNSQEMGIRHYSRNSELRQTAIYDGEIEYDYKFETDENGFRITHRCDIRNPKSVIAITGDSFTEGQGSSIVWVSKIQNKLCKNKIKTFNTAMAGYSIIGMRKSLDYAKNSLGASHSIVAITTGDILRSHAEMISNEVCSVYASRTNKCGDSATWWHFPSNLYGEELINYSKTKFKYGLKEVYKNAKFDIKNKIRSWENKNPKNKNLYLNTKAMNHISSIYGPKKTLLIIIPTKLDIGLENKPNKKKKFSKNLNIFLKKINNDIEVYDLRSCPLTKNHFYKKDGHPNESGQKLIGECAYGVLDIKKFLSVSNL